MTRETVVVHVDWTRCDGHGACAELLPELFATDEWGYPLSRDGSRDPEVPPGLGSEAKRAEKACPALALRLGVVRRDG